MTIENLLEGAGYVMVPIESIRTTRDVPTGIAYHSATIFSGVVDWDWEKPIHFFVHSYTEYPLVRSHGIWYVLLDVSFLRNSDEYEKVAENTSQYLLSCKWDPTLIFSTLGNEYRNPEIARVTEKEFLSWSGCPVSLNWEDQLTFSK